MRYIDNLGDSPESEGVPPSRPRKPDLWPLAAKTKNFFFGNRRIGELRFGWKSRYGFKMVEPYTILRTRTIHTFPFTEAGWNDAWSVMSEEYPDLATAVAAAAFKAGVSNAAPEPGETTESPRLVFRLSVVNGAGWAPPIGNIARLLLFEDRIEIGSATELSKRLPIPLTRFLDLRIEGQSLSRGFGFFGGGFGVKGAAEGMLAASVLDALTRRTQKWVTIELVTDDGWVQLRLDDADVIQVREDLRVLADAIVSRQSTSAHSGSDLTQNGTDLVTALERLSKLREDGALSDEEFLQAKEKLLNSA
jgi:hypothetical protein